MKNIIGVAERRSIVKALSIRQPWAWLIANGCKDIENRTWRTKFRGEFFVHAGKKFDSEGYDWVTSEMNIALPGKEEFERGGIVGRAEIVDCVSQFESPWFSGPFGFVVRNAETAAFHACRGRLGFFDIVI